MLGSSVLEAELCCLEQHLQLWELQRGLRFNPTLNSNNEISFESKPERKYALVFFVMSKLPHSVIFVRKIL